MNLCYHIKYSDIEIDESKSFKEHNSNDLILEIKNSTHINIYHVIQFTAFIIATHSNTENLLQNLNISAFCILRNILLFSSGAKIVDLISEMMY